MTTISVSSQQPATFDKAGYEALDYVEVDSVIDFGPFYVREIPVIHCYTDAAYPNHLKPVEIAIKKALNHE